MDFCAGLKRVIHIGQNEQQLWIKMKIIFNFGWKNDYFHRSGAPAILLDNADKEIVWRKKI